LLEGEKGRDTANGACLGRSSWLLFVLNPGVWGLGEPGGGAEPELPRHRIFFVFVPMATSTLFGRGFFPFGWGGLGATGGKEGPQRGFGEEEL